MNRRALLRRTAGLGALALAGCVVENPDSQTEPNPAARSDGPIVDATVTTTDAGCAERDAGTATLSFDDGEPAVRFSGVLIAGDPCHEVTVESVEMGDDALAVTLGTERTDESGTPQACMDCVGGLAFEGAVTLAESLPETASVRYDGDVLAEAESGSTATPENMAPEITDTAFSQTQEYAGTRPDVLFQSEESRVILRGSITGSNGCAAAELGSVAYDAEADRLDVNVVTVDTSGKDEVCSQETIQLGYEVRVSFDVGVPGEVSLSHNGDGVMGAGHDSATAEAPE
jgi:hypothetical protein